MIDVVVLVVLIAPLVDLNTFHGGQHPMVMISSYSSNRRPFISSSSFTPSKLVP